MTRITYMNLFDLTLDFALYLSAWACYAMLTKIFWQEPGDGANNCL